MKPKLIHWVNVVIAKIDRSTTTYDADFDEPVGNVVYLTAKTIKAQIKYFQMKRVEATAAGFEQRGDGYILIDIDDEDKVDLLAKITKIGDDTLELYVREIAPAAHYEGANFRRVYFESREKGSD